MDEQDEDLARLTDLDVTWGFDQHACLQERSQEAPVAGDAGNGTAETTDSAQGGAVDASSVLAGRVETVETMDSSQGGAVSAASIPAGDDERDSGALAATAPTKGTTMIPPQSCRGRKLTISVAGDGCPRQ